MKFQNLPSAALGRICSFLDPRSRVMFLLACGTLYEAPKVAKRSEQETLPNHSCFFCFVVALYREMKNETEETGDRGTMRFQMRNKHLFEGHFRAASGERWHKTQYRRRHYSDAKPDPAINNIQLYLGLGSKNKIRLFKYTSNIIKR